MIQNILSLLTIDTYIFLEPLAQFEFINYNTFEDYTNTLDSTSEVITSYSIIDDNIVLSENITDFEKITSNFILSIQPEHLFYNFILLLSFAISKVNIFFINFLNNTFIGYLLILIVLLFLYSLTKNFNIIHTNWQYMLFQTYRFVLNILETQVGKKAQKFFPYVFAIFIIILIANLTGMIFYAFTLTSHIMVTFTLGISSFIGLTILGFSTQKLSFLNLFLPKGIPAALVPILVVVEIISYTSRALSLSIRLFANLMSGHTLLHILAFFASKICKISYIVASLGFLLIIAIIMLELCIAMLQAYVFTILICIYLNDSINPADH